MPGTSTGCVVMIGVVLVDAVGVIAVGELAETFVTAPSPADSTPGRAPSAPAQMVTTDSAASSSHPLTAARSRAR